ncbi:type VII toxin-antitoxin system HepT family RNase toxin [Thermodesulfovibrio hydrogeniphilus]
MVIARLNLNKIQKILSLIQEYLVEIESLAQLSLEEFLADKKTQAAAESFLRRALEAIFDISRHILSKTYNFKELEYKRIANELGKKGIVDKDYAEILIKMAGYRNRMVHFYHEIPPEELYAIIKNHRSDIERFINEIQKFLSKIQEENNA